jgi:hypothetical protein
MGEKRYARRFLVESSGRRIPLGITRHRNEYNIKMQFREILWMVWSGFTWPRVGTNGGLLRIQ